MAESSLLDDMIYMIHNYLFKFWKLKCSRTVFYITILKTYKQPYLWILLLLGRICYEDATMHL